jgi:hypothetical protein
MTSRSDAGAVVSKPLGIAWAGFLESCGSGRVWQFLGCRELLLVYKWTAAPFAWALLAGTAALVVVSLLTKREDPERIARFFEAMKRSSDGDSGTETAPLAPDRGQDLLLIDLPGWLSRDRWRGFFRRYREDLVGFVLAWASVGALILLAWAIMQIGR